MNIITVTNGGLGYLIAYYIEKTGQTIFNCKKSDLPYIDEYDNSLIEVEINNYNGCYPTWVEQDCIVKCIEIENNTIIVDNIEEFLNNNYIYEMDKNKG